MYRQMPPNRFRRKLRQLYEQGTVDDRSGGRTSSMSRQHEHTIHDRPMHRGRPKAAERTQFAQIQSNEHTHHGSERICEPLNRICGNICKLINPSSDNPC